MAKGHGFYLQHAKGFEFLHLIFYFKQKKKNKKKTNKKQKHV